MRNSAWYHKLWLKKADEFPLKEDAHASWQEMQQLLDEHMPVVKAGTDKKPGKSVGSTLVSMLGFILPAAAMIGTITFVAVKHSFKPKPENKQQHQHILNKQGNHAFADSSKVSADSALSAAAPATAIQTASAHKGPGQMASINVTTALPTSAHGQNNVSGPPAANPAKYAVSSQPANPSSAGMQSTYLLEYSSQPAFFPIVAPDTSAQNNGSLWHAISGMNINSLPGFADAPSNGSNRITAEPDRDDIFVNHADKQQLNKLTRGHEKKTPKIKGSSSLYLAPLILGDGGPFSLSLSSGLNWPGGTGNLFAGLSVGYQFKDKWHLYTGVTLNVNQHITDTYLHASFAPRDTGVTFKIKDEQKAAQVINIPFNLEYSISKLISISGGPQISIASQFKSSAGRSAYILDVPNIRDTISRGKSIDSALNLTTLNKINIGISGGVSIHLNQRLHIDARYQQNLTPYHFNNSYLGNSKVYYHSVQVGLRYQFGN